MKKDLHTTTTYQAGAIQASVHRNLQKICDIILEPFGITKMQWLIIGHVLDTGKAGIRTSDLATVLSTTLPYITTSVNILQAQGYLIRTDNNQDGRSKLLAVNPSFIPQCELIEQSLRKGLQESLYTQIDPADFRIYIKVLHQLDEIVKDKFDKKSSE